MQGIRLGDFDVHPDEGRVSGPTGEHRLEPKVMAVLVELMQRPGEVVTRQQLLDRVWTGLVVTDDALTRCVSELRAALGDERNAPRYLETLPKRGYRLMVAPTARLVPVAQALPGEPTSPGPVSSEPSPPDAPATAQGPSVPSRTVLGLCAAVVVITAVGGWLWWPRTDRDPEPPSVAIVPFVTSGEGPTDIRYLAEGLAEELLNALVRVKGLRVASRSSSFASEAQQEDPVVAGRKLGVDAVLTGTLRRSGSHLRINARLIDTRTGFHVWTQSYDRDLDSVFAMQDDIATQVARALRVGSDAGVQVARVSSNIEAFDYYLLGRYQWNKRTPQSLARAIEFFSEAIALDEGFALAHAGIADAYQLAASYGDFPEDRANALARQAIDRALALDPGLSEAHASQGMLLMHAKDYPAAERALRRAVSLNPHYPMALMWLGLVLQTQGRVNEALEWLEEASSADPGHQVIRYNLADALMAHGDYAGARRVLAEEDDGVADENPLAHSFLWLKAQLALDLGQTDEATRLAKTLINSPTKRLGGYLALADIARREGDAAAARDWIASAAAQEATPAYELHVAALAEHALDGDADGFEAQLTRWRAHADASARPTALELGWKGVLEVRRSEFRLAAESLEAALAREDDKTYDLSLRLCYIGFLLVALGALDEGERVDSWRQVGATFVATARANGQGSVRYLMEEAYFFAAAGRARDAVATLSRVIAFGARLPRTALDDPRFGPVRQSPELRAFRSMLTDATIAVESSACVVPCAPTVATAVGLGKDPIRAGSRPLPRPRDAAAQVSDRALQGS